MKISVDPRSICENLRPSIILEINLLLSDTMSFLHETIYDDLPSDVRQRTAVCLLDLIGSLAGSRQTRQSQIVHEYAAAVYGGDQATLLLDGRRVSAPGAALATGLTIDSLDIHDSHKESLGHAGVHIFAALVAIAEQRIASGGRPLSGAEFLAAMAVGYDIACRAGIALHATACDYHTSGAWGAVSSAALYARLHGLDGERTRHALGIAEYYGPRSQMMRCIDHPTMLKDGSGWGAMVGISAGMLAQQGFSGAPALTIEAPEVAEIWADLGQRWMVMDQGFKAHGVCWWAQPAIEATLALAREHHPALEEITAIDVETFEKATHLAHPRPTATDEAQYSLPFPVAAALVKWATGGESWYGLGPRQLLEAHLNDEQTLALAERVALHPAADLTARFPQQMMARVKIQLADGRTLQSQTTTFRGEDNAPFTEEDLRIKYRWLAGDVLSAERVAAIEEEVFALAERPTVEALLGLMYSP